MSLIEIKGTAPSGEGRVLVSEVQTEGEGGRV